MPDPNSDLSWLIADPRGRRSGGLTTRSATMLTRFLTWLRNLWDRLLGRTPPIEQQRRFGGGSGLIAYQINHA